MAKISGKITDPKSGVIYTQEAEGKVIDIDMDNVVMEPGSLKQLQISVLPEGESIYYNIRYEAVCTENHNSNR